MKGQPKGLIAAALANMGERFGFYIMMAILTLFISAKFGLNETTAGYIYSGFYASIYLLALVGGIIADKTRNYKGTIMWGLGGDVAGLPDHRHPHADARVQSAALPDADVRRPAGDSLRQRPFQGQSPGARGADVRQQGVQRQA